MSWVTETFDDAPLEIIDGDRGKNYPSQNDLLEEGDCLFLSATNVTKDGFAFDKCQFITAQRDQLLRKGKVKRNHVILTTRGTLGNVAFYTGSVPFESVRINSGMVTIQSDQTKLLPRYLYYYVKSRLFQSQVQALQSGAAQPQLPIRDIKKIKISYPDTSKQENIAEVIGAYDDLIENNRRRIALLEESARLLYREWFVHLRFPGYTTTKIIDGVPDGWRQSSIGKHSPFAYGKALRADTRNAGNVKVYGSSGVVGSHDKKLVSGPSIIIGRKGNVGSVYWEEGDFWPIDTVYFTQPENSDLFTYYAMQHVQFINTDVAVPGLNRNLAHSRELLIPSKDLLLAFKKQADKFHSQIKILGRQNEKLTEARDILLPRLMDGRIEV